MFSLDGIKIEAQVVIDQRQIRIQGSSEPIGYSSAFLKGS